ncbi:hypothetical protein OWR29_17090 [Actinoplanes sp. Pm04-4]|uniref:Uncharacterized protein n=1 Tax=Paractinoplanes pyxinae TaxID=2997416 RepID=A0ABT4AZQ0_9ACTN|nr:hypothetical protein [Actinoplanes pyxinae]MCY1139719.1 hypothetical protein [Actinoplanes pyxinae]
MSFEDDEYWEDEYSEYSIMPQSAVVQERQYERRESPDGVIPTRRGNPDGPVDELAARRQRRAHGNVGADGRPQAAFDTQRPSWLDDPDFAPVDTSQPNLAGDDFEDVDFNRPELGADFDAPDTFADSAQRRHNDRYDLHDDIDEPYDHRDLVAYGHGPNPGVKTVSRSDDEPVGRRRQAPRREDERRPRREPERRPRREERQAPPAPAASGRAQVPEARPDDSHNLYRRPASRRDEAYDYDDRPRRSRSGSREEMIWDEPAAAPRGYDEGYDNSDVRDRRRGGSRRPDAYEFDERRRDDVRRDDPRRDESRRDESRRDDERRRRDGYEERRPWPAEADEGRGRPAARDDRRTIEGEILDDRAPRTIEGEIVEERRRPARDSRRVPAARQTWDDQQGWVEDERWDDGRPVGGQGWAEQPQRTTGRARVEPVAEGAAWVGEGTAEHDTVAAASAPMPPAPAARAASSAAEPEDDRAGVDDSPRVISKATPPAAPRVVGKEEPPPAPRVVKADPPAAPRVVGTHAPTPAARVVNPAPTPATPAPPAVPPSAERPPSAPAARASVPTPAPSVPRPAPARPSVPPQPPGLVPAPPARDSDQRTPGHDIPAAPAARGSVPPSDSSLPGTRGPVPPGDSSQAGMRGPVPPGDSSQAGMRGPVPPGDPSQPGTRGPVPPEPEGARTSLPAHAPDSARAARPPRPMLNPAGQPSSRGSVPSPAPDGQGQPGPRGPVPPNVTADQASPTPGQAARGPVPPQRPVDPSLMTTDPRLQMPRSRRSPRTAHVFLADGDDPWSMVPDEAPPAALPSGGLGRPVSPAAPGRPQGPGPQGATHPGQQPPDAATGPAPQDRSPAAYGPPPAAAAPSGVVQSGNAPSDAPAASGPAQQGAPRGTASAAQPGFPHGPAHPGTPAAAQPGDPQDPTRRGVAPGTPAPAQRGGPHDPSQRGNGPGAPAPAQPGGLQHHGAVPGSPGTAKPGVQQDPTRRGPDAGRPDAAPAAPGVAPQGPPQHGQPPYERGAGQPASELPIKQYPAPPQAQPSPPAAPDVQPKPANPVPPHGGPTADQARSHPAGDHPVAPGQQASDWAPRATEQPPADAHTSGVHKTGEFFRRAVDKLFGGSSSHDIDKHVPGRQVPDRGRPTGGHPVVEPQVPTQRTPAQQPAPTQQPQPAGAQQTPVHPGPEGRAPSQYAPGPQPQGERVPGQHAPGQHVAGQHVPGQHVRSTHAPGQHLPGQHAPDRQVADEQFQGQHAPGQQATDEHGQGQHVTGRQAPAQPAQHAPDQQTPRRYPPAEHVLGENGPGRRPDGRHESGWEVAGPQADEQLKGGQTAPGPHVPAQQAWDRDSGQPAAGQNQGPAGWNGAEQLGASESPWAPGAGERPTSLASAPVSAARGGSPAAQQSPAVPRQVPAQPQGEAPTQPLTSARPGGTAHDVPQAPRADGAPASIRPPWQDDSWAPPGDNRGQRPEDERAVDQGLPRDAEGRPQNGPEAIAPQSPADSGASGMSSQISFPLRPRSAPPAVGSDTQDFQPRTPEVPTQRPPAESPSNGNWAPQPPYESQSAPTAPASRDRRDDVAPPAPATDRQASTDGRMPAAASAEAQATASSQTPPAASREAQATATSQTTTAASHEPQAAAPSQPPTAASSAAPVGGNHDGWDSAVPPRSGESAEQGQPDDGRAPGRVDGPGQGAESGTSARGSRHAGPDDGSESGPATPSDPTRLGAHAAPYMDADGSLHNLRPIGRLAVSGADAPQRTAETAFGGMWFGSKATSDDGSAPDAEPEQPTAAETTGRPDSSAAQPDESGAHTEQPTPHHDVPAVPNGQQAAQHQPSAGPNGQRAVDQAPLPDGNGQRMSPADQAHQPVAHPEHRKQPEQREAGAASQHSLSAQPDEATPDPRDGVVIDLDVSALFKGVTLPEDQPPVDAASVRAKIDERMAAPRMPRERVAEPEKERPSLSAADLEAIRWRLDGATLREVVDDREALRELGERLDGPLADEVDNVAKAGLLSVRAEVYRLLGELGMAAAASRLALAHAESARDMQSEVIAQAELAHILRLRGDFKEADRLFARATGSEVPATLRSVVHENAGRSCFDQGRHMEALDHFARAVRLGRPDDSELAARVGVCLEAVYIHVLRDGWGPYPRTREDILGIRTALDESTAEQPVIPPR